MVFFIPFVVQTIIRISFEAEDGLLLAQLCTNSIMQNFDSLDNDEDDIITEKNLHHRVLKF